MSPTVPVSRIEDDVPTLVPCRACRTAAERHRCVWCLGAGMVTPDEQARQRLRWPESNGA